jgi:hypothetical protein
MKALLKKILPHVSVLVFFILLVTVYFSPVFFDDKEIRMGDVEKWQGMSKELRDYKQTEESKDFPVLSWTGSMFSGMPSYTITTQKVPSNFLNIIEIPIRLFHDSDASIILAALICFYILMCVMGVNIWLAIAGSIAFAFASYNMVIIEAGHMTKAYVIAYMPLTIAGMLLVFKEKWLWGVTLTILGIALSLKNNHIQITYYLAVFCFILFLAYFAKQIKSGNYLTPIKTTGLFLICILLAILPNIGSLYSNYEMSKESIRGQSELTEKTTGKTEKVSSGLDIDYAFAWSYGKAETMTLLIPNFHGGSSGGELGPDSEIYKTMKANRAQVGKTIQAATYWGDQPFTSGPVYFGALVCFLFVFGMFIIKNPAKWWLLSAVLFFILISWGRNLMWFNEFLFHHLPMYNKFRTVSMSLVIPGLIFPIVGIWGLKELFTRKQDRETLLKSFYWSLGIVGGLCLVFWIMPSAFFDFRSPNDAQYQFPDWYYDALLKDREMLLKNDAFRSLVFILLGGGLIYWFIRSKNAVNTAKYVAMGIALLILTDLWTVDRRYINNDTFVSKKSIDAFKKTTADDFILRDTDFSYRVLNLNNPFNDSYTSYYHKSIGGYNAAKLRRYQELVDYRISKEINQIVNGFQQVKTQEDFENMHIFQHIPTLNMLNMRYLIYNSEQPPVVNANAYGNAWFVDNYKFVEDADAEMAALNEINPLETAVVDKRFLDNLDGFSFRKDENATIEMISYEPVRIRYKSKAVSDQLAMFSEVYYPHGWEATVDGTPAEHFRADWILRGMIVPAGEHLIEFVFMPKKYIAASRIASVSSLLILLLLLATAGLSVWHYYKKETQPKPAEKKMTTRK